MNAPTWAETLLHVLIRRHGNDVGAIRRLVAKFEGQVSLYDSDEQRAAYTHVIDGLKKHLATLAQPAEAQRGP